MNIINIVLLALIATIYTSSDSIPTTTVTEHVTTTIPSGGTDRPVFIQVNVNIPAITVTAPTDLWQVWTPFV